jgi:uncharacterized protein (DUF488 family)
MPKIFTIGYQGETLGGFFEKLAAAGAHRIIDVRNNPFSRKPGFSKKALALALARRRIDYFHFPALGVPKDKRQNIKTPAARKKVFDYYEKRLLPAADQDQKEALRLIREKPSALLCFEKDPADCHRSRLAAALAKKSRLAIRHL